MDSNTPRIAGRHFLQIPGPTPVPDRILRAMDNAVIDHRGPGFQKLAQRVAHKIKAVFDTRGEVIIYPSSGTGAWEAALTNSLSPGDLILMFETGHFAQLWQKMATRLGLEAELLQSDWRRGADADRIEARLREDKDRKIKAVCVVHNETSTGCVTSIPAIRAALDAAGHPALLIVDTISSLASIEYHHDAWRVDVTVAGSQKGLMLPPGLSFNAVSEKALAASMSSKLPKAFWSWQEMLSSMHRNQFPYTPATTLLYGLDAALDMLNEEGMQGVFARHDRHAEATRRAAKAWGLEIVCAVREQYSSSLTAILMPDGHDGDTFRKAVLETFDMSLGSGLGRLAGKVFRIGHLGDTNDLTILGALAGVEMGLDLCRVPYKKGGIQVAVDYLATQARNQPRMAAE